MMDLRLGDCREVLPTLAADSVDAVVCDPPAGIAFMGKEFDTFHGRDAFIAFLSAVMAECLRVLRPGGYALVWAIPRTSHWTATALEDAGFEIRDRISHLFGTGFPKSQACLKPACEDWWLCRRPGRGMTPLQIDAARIPANGEDRGRPPRTANAIYGNGNGTNLTASESHPAGRWPANTVIQHHPECNGSCHPECAVRLLDEQAGERPVSGSARNGRPAQSTSDGVQNVYGAGLGRQGMLHNDSGGASRFFYTPKAPRRERWFYCRDCRGAYPPGARPGHQHGHARPDGTPDWSHLTSHPTQKSLDLMQWLCRLVTPPGGLVLDPFMGSGSTAAACMREGFGFVGIEQDQQYYEIARRRLAVVQWDEEQDLPLFAATGD